MLLQPCSYLVPRLCSLGLFVGAPGTGGFHSNIQRCCLVFVPINGFGKLTCVVCEDFRFMARA